MAAPKEAALIELAYAASFVLFATEHKRPWDQPIAGIRPSEIENECDRLTNELGLQPVIGPQSFDEVQFTIQRQLREERHREGFEMGMLLVKQHVLLGWLQCYPDAKERPVVCFELDRIRQSLTSLFRYFRLHEPCAKLPALPLPGTPDSEWISWSGDALKNCILDEFESQSSAARVKA